MLMFVWNMLIKLLSNGLFLPTLPHLCPYQCKCVVFAYIAVNEQLKEQIKDVDAAQSKEVSVFWVGMAEVNTSRLDFQMFNKNQLDQ